MPEAKRSSRSPVLVVMLGMLGIQVKMKKKIKIPWFPSAAKETNKKKK